MNFASYAAFRTAVQSMIDGDDISQSDLSVTTLDMLIGAGEQRIYRDMRSSTQDAALSIAVTSNVATLPSDFLELKSLYIGGNFAATYVPYEVMQDLIQKASRTGNAPVRYTLEGDTLIFYPSITGVTVTGRYYKRFADISTGLNNLFTRHPDVFLYAALSESAPFLGEMTRLQIWEQKYTSLVRAANEQERRRQTRGSKLQTRLA
jgi:hypothetical protein